jgi:hypothetical protein
LARTFLATYIDDPLAIPLAINVATACLGEYEFWLVSIPSGAIEIKSQVRAHCLAKGIPVKTFDVKGVKPNNHVDSAMRSSVGICGDQDFLVACDQWTCFAASGTVNLLSRYLDVRTDVPAVLPCLIGTERAAYLHQVMSRLPSWLISDWNASYIDSFVFPSTAAEVLEGIHTTFLNSLQSDPSGRTWRFGEYGAISGERLPHQVVVFRCGASEWLKQITKLSDAAMPIKMPRIPIYGGAVMAHLGPHTHHRHLFHRKVVERYAKLPPPASKTFDMVKVVTREWQPLHEHDFTFLISTYKKTELSEAAVSARLLLSACRVNPKRILIVSGAHEKAEETTLEGVRMKRVTHNSIDHNALIEATKEGVSGAVFLLHDTTRPGRNFKELTLGVPCIGGHTAAFMNGWCNMGVFTADYLQANANYILSLENMSKFQAVLSEQVYARFGNRTYYQDMADIRWDGYQYFGGDGRKRSILYSPNLDLYKHQTYFMQADCTQELFRAYRTHPRMVLSRMDLR